MRNWDSAILILGCNYKKGGRALCSETLKRCDVGAMLWDNLTRSGGNPVVILGADKDPKGPFQQRVCMAEDMRWELSKRNVSWSQIIVRPKGWGSRYEIRAALEVMKEFRLTELHLVSSWYHYLGLRMLMHQTAGEVKWYFHTVWTGGLEMVLRELYKLPAQALYLTFPRMARLIPDIQRRSLY